MNGLEEEIRRQQKLGSEAIRPVSNGFDAACAVMDLINATQKTINPSVLVEKRASVMKQTPDDRYAAMWAAFGTKTIQAMAKGCRYLAAIWEGAWSAGQGAGKIKQGHILQPDKIEALYNSAAFLPSWSLDTYKLKKNGKVLK